MRRYTFDCPSQMMSSAFTKAISFLILANNIACFVDSPMGHHRDYLNLVKRRAFLPIERASIQLELPSQLTDVVHKVKMGISSDMCDNAIDNLHIDWDGNPVNYTCFHPKNPYPVSQKTKPLEECEIPKGYFPQHLCMNRVINYDSDIPTYGNHRPLWPVYGEYSFVPTQRWLHTLEHGGIVMLYHPCAEPLEVDRLKILIKSCIRKHVITPSILLPSKRPLALLAWGCKLLMSTIDTDVVTKFIKEHALKAPEGLLPKQGQYRYKLIEKSLTVPGSDYQDSKLCPTF